MQADDVRGERVSGKDMFVLFVVVAPMFAYVYGSLTLGWGFNELAAAFLIGGAIAGLAGGLGIAESDCTATSPEG